MMKYVPHNRFRYHDSQLLTNYPTGPLPNALPVRLRAVGSSCGPDKGSEHLHLLYAVLDEDTNHFEVAHFRRPV